MCIFACSLGVLAMLSEVTSRTSSALDLWLTHPLNGPLESGPVNGSEPIYRYTVQVLSFSSGPILPGGHSSDSTHSHSSIILYTTFC